MPASTDATVKAMRAAREELKAVRKLSPLITFFSIAKTARQTDSKLINEISKISTIVILSPRLTKWRDTAKLLAVLARNACVRKAKLPRVTPVPENGRLKSGYYCRLSGALSNGERLDSLEVAIPEFGQAA